MSSPNTEKAPEHEEGSRARTLAHTEHVLPTGVPRAVPKGALTWFANNFLHGNLELSMKIL